MEPKQQRFSIWYFVIVLGTLMLLQSVFYAPHREVLELQGVAAASARSPAALSPFHG